jgi:hypothetical protein
MKTIMNKFMLLFLGALFLFSACEKNDPNVIDDPEPGTEPGTNPDPDPDPETRRDSMFVLTARKSAYFGTDILYTYNTLDEGILVTVGTGVEQDGSTRNYVVNNDLFFSLLFNQSQAGAVTGYIINGDKRLEKKTEFQSETMTAYGNVGDEILLFKNAWQPEEEYTQWYRLNSKTMQIAGRGEINANELAGNGEKAFFMDVEKVGEKVFAAFWCVESGKNFASDNSRDTTYIAVYSYPAMQLEKVIKDARTGGIGAYFTDGMDLDENGDLYALGMKLNWNKSGEYSVKTPVAFTKIKKGTTEYDKSYFLNLTDATGGQYVWRKQYLGKGYFLLSVCPKPYVYATMHYGRMMGGFKFAVVNVYDGTFNWVAGLPDATSIQSTTADYGYSDLDGTGYIGIYYTDDGVAKSVVYKVDAATATATAGLATDGEAAITGIFKVPVTE